MMLLRALCLCVGAQQIAAHLVPFVLLTSAFPTCTWASQNTHEQLRVYLHLVIKGRSI